MNATRTVSQTGIRRSVWRSSTTRESLRRTTRLAPPPQRRMASSSSDQQQQPSAVGNFYKTFTRPVTKVLLMAVFTYQLAYWGWVKLEQDEIRADREEEINTLEQKVSSLTASLRDRKSEDAAATAAAAGGGGQIASGDKKRSAWWPW